MKWKKNLRKIPQHIERKVKNINADDVVVCVAKEFKAEDLKNNILSHLGIVLTKEGLKFPREIIPPAKSGKFSNRNINGYEIIRRDLGKQTIGYRTVEVPNWRGYGTHDVDWPIKGYPRDYISPSNYSIKIEVLDDKPGLAKYLIKCELSHILNKSSKQFEEDLLYCLNILQENIGGCDVARAGTQFSEYLKTIHVSWEILPPGEIDKALSLIFKGKKPAKKEIKDTRERLGFFQSLKPLKIVVGTSGFVRYFGALINSELVVFDNMSYGNAIYVMFKKWEELSQKSKTELLNGRHHTDFERIVHRAGWQEIVEKIIKEKTA